MDIVLSKGVWIKCTDQLQTAPEASATEVGKRREKASTWVWSVSTRPDLFLNKSRGSWNKCKVWRKSVPTSDRAWAEKSHQSSTKKLICFYGRTVSLPPRSHLVALSSGRGGDTPPVGRQDALLKATGGCSGLKAHRHRVCSFPQRGDCLWAQTRAPIL